jgi:hypothetical protein
MAEQDQGMMTRFDKEAHSFVIRMWRENRDQPDAEGEWRGWIDHVQTGKRHYFRQVQTISRIVSGYVSEPSPVDSVTQAVQNED